MSFFDLKIAAIYIFQIVLGTLGNLSLLIHYICLHCRGDREQSTDLILRHLTVANFLVILSIGIPQTMAAFGLNDFLKDFECNLVLYVHRVARGVSISSTCLLNVFQAITISPRDLRCANLKLTVPKYIGPSTLLFWALHMLINVIFPIYGSSKRNNKTTSNQNKLGYCSLSLNDNIKFSLFTALISSHDVVCLGLMSWASGSMVFILYRHKQRVRHIYRSHVSHRSSPETKASQSILVLVSTFVLCYALSSITYTYLAFFGNPSLWLLNASPFITRCFPTISPFIFISSDPRNLKNTFGPVSLLEK
ncbi:PREDICTED: vomeronasal type-1 receptor 2-like [Chrysochloris asiatica]|uniref:Vomeronasal type-1 receptor n=1 Tax=Chrysochloris asiatica TaxID=185453 RepID=A0A9B0TQ50_CHRAS|nr:PREDICTED: vomeronasal type-1 receptor 2-like [Chrysochloris asiatica]